MFKTLKTKINSLKPSIGQFAGCKKYIFKSVLLLCFKSINLYYMNKKNAQFVTRKLQSIMELVMAFSYTNALPAVINSDQIR